MSLRPEVFEASVSSTGCVRSLAVNKQLSKNVHEIFLLGLKSNLPLNGRPRRALGKDTGTGAAHVTQH